MGNNMTKKQFISIAEQHTYDCMVHLYKASMSEDERQKYQTRMKKMLQVKQLAANDARADYDKYFEMFMAATKAWKPSKMKVIK